MRISDWSSDVCSSDLNRCPPPLFQLSVTGLPGSRTGADAVHAVFASGSVTPSPDQPICKKYASLAPAGDSSRTGSEFLRSEERRVGTEWGGTCRYRWTPVL